MRVLVLGQVVVALAALTLLGGCFYIKVDDHGDDRASHRDRPASSCSSSNTASCKPE